MSATDHCDRMTAERQADVRFALTEAAAAIGRKVYPGVPQPRRRAASPLQDAVN
jgi:hypothetical protein